MSEFVKVLALLVLDVKRLPKNDFLKSDFYYEESAVLKNHIIIL